MPDPIAYSSLDLDTLVRTVFGEARGEAVAGQQAVAWVIRNRASWDPPAWWGRTIAGVCSSPWQFSCWNRTDPNRAEMLGIKVNDPRYVAIRAAVLPVLAGEVADPTLGSTSYKRAGTQASWDAAVAGIEPVTIGHHLFWRLAPSAKTASPFLDTPAAAEAPSPATLPAPAAAGPAARAPAAAPPVPFWRAWITRIFP